MAKKVRKSNGCLWSLDLETYQDLSFQGAANLLNARNIDAAFFSIREGANLVLELRDIVAIGLEPFLKDIERSALCKARYGNSGLKINTICSEALLLASKNLPPRVVYSLLTGLYDKGFYKDFKLFTKEKSHKQSSDFGIIPLHEAAERFYKGCAKPSDPQWIAVGTLFLGLILTGIGLLIIRRLSFKDRRVFIPDDGRGQAMLKSPTASVSRPAVFPERAIKHLVFISYSRKDEQEKEALLTHLRVLEQGAVLIKVWSDDRIAGGEQWKPAIEEAISSAKVAILLVSENFLTSDFINRKEVPKLLQRRAGEGLRVIPVIAKPCAWQHIDWLAAMNVRPKNGNPIWKGQSCVEEELVKIADEVAALVQC
jgi:TIR domain/NMT1-like family